MNHAPDRRQKNMLLYWATVAGSIVAIGGGVSMGYKVFAAPAVQAQIDGCMKTHEVKQAARDEKIDMVFERIVENQQKQGEALARIEGELRAMRGRR